MLRHTKIKLKGDVISKGFEPQQTMIPEKSQFAPRKETLKMHELRNGIKRP